MTSFCAVAACVMACAFAGNQSGGDRSPSQSEDHRGDRSPHSKAADEPRIVSVKKIWDRAPHNAFTDLVRWHDQWYCTCRESDGHVGGDGKLRMLASADGEAWQPVALVEEEGVDLRDPKLSVTPDDRLMIIAGGSVYGGTKTLQGRQPRVAFSRDGREWSAPQRVMSEGEWLWRVTWHEGKAYGVSYNASARQTKEAEQAAQSSKPAPPGPADIPASDARMQKGVAWLQSHQCASGRWFTPTSSRRTMNLPSNSGTAYAVLALQACGEIPSLNRK